MIYNYYIDPEVLSGEAGNNASALNVLTLLRGISENGFISIFNEQGFWIGDVNKDEDDGSNITAAVNLISDPDTKKRIKGMLKHLMSHRRIIDVLGTPEGSKDLLKAALLKAESECINVAISNRTAKEMGEPAGDCLLTNLHDYFISEVEDQRRNYVQVGSFFHGGEKNSSEFLAEHFKFIMQHARTVEIYDKLIGKGSDNFRESLKQFLSYLESTNGEPSKCLVRIHASNPNEGRINNLKNWLPNGTQQIQIELNIYGEPGDDIEFHHDRFLVIDDFAFMISRGFDFLDTSGMNKDVSVDFKSKDQVMKCIRNMAQSGCTTASIRIR